MNRRIATLILLISALFVSSYARASLVQYTYTGSVFDAAAGSPYNASAYQAGVDRITGSFIIDDADMVSLSGQNVFSDIISFSFDDGSSGSPYPSTITDAAVIPPSNFVFSTDASGTILSWDVVLVVNSVYRSMTWCNTGDGCTGSGAALRDSVKNRSPTIGSTASSNTPGVWSAAAVVPVPPAALLFGSAIGLLGWARRRTR